VAAESLLEAFEICERHHLRKPAMEQPEYNLLARRRWNTSTRHHRPVRHRSHDLEPAASGQLTGKYLDGVPEGSRGLARRLRVAGGVAHRRSGATPRSGAEAVADDLGCSLAQLAIAWCARNPQVSSVITGASRPAQVRENMAALEVIARLDTDVLDRIDKITK